MATDCTETVLICHERDLFFCRSHGRVQALDLRTARQSMQAKASSFGYILHTESGSSPRHGNSHIEHHGHLRTTADGHKVQKVSSSCTSAIHSQAAYGNDTSAAIHVLTSATPASATPATQSDDPCHQVPRLPHKVKVDVTKCHACHTKRRGVPARPGNQARHQSQPSAISATPATQSDDPCHQVPRLPHKVKVDVTKCHACHAKRRGVPARPGNQARHQSQPSAISATPATQSDDPCVDKCHACHAK